MILWKLNIDVRMKALVRNAQGFFCCKYFTRLFASEREQIAIMADEKLNSQIFRRLFAINRSEMRVSMDYYYMAMRGSLVVGLNTDLDHHLADEVRQVIDEIVEERGIRSIIFDFSKVTFMDSSGIGLIMGRYKKMHQNGRIAIVAPCKSVERILQISGLHKLVTVFGDLGEALDSCEVHDDNIAAGKGGKRNVEF